jgi:hypothetical protein
MEQRLENSTLIALRELRSYERERQLAERREEETRLAREGKERERQAEEVVRERALEKQLRLDLQRAQDEVVRFQLEMEKRTSEAMQAPRPLPTILNAKTSLVARSSARRERLVAWGCTALLASALVFMIGVRRNAAMPSTPLQTVSCPGSVAPSPSPASVSPAPATPTATSQVPTSDPVASNLARRHGPAPHPRDRNEPHPVRKPNPPKPKPACDGTDPLCGLHVNSIGP